ncbi:MAG: hypothetical protein IT365_14005 [Candidatus Hydrogenedentes bacterium]|nr:hypothetical protein [Candidatus Hydrogenedentota bacterium]
MLEPNLVLLFTRRLERAKISYMVTGSAAAMIFGEPRLTNDVDIVVLLDRESAANMVEAFPIAEFYCPPQEVISLEASRQQRGHFNVIHHETGFKADLYLSGRDSLHVWGLANSIRVHIGDDTVTIAPPEYVIVRKLEYFREVGSEKHLRDIRAMLQNSREAIRHSDLEQFIAERGLGDVWQKAREIQN